MTEESVVTFDEAVEICRDMGFVNDSAPVKANMTELYNHLQGEAANPVTLFNIKVFLCTIMYFTHPWMKPVVDQEEDEHFGEEYENRPKKKINT